MNKTNIFDLYTDYLITSFSYTTATGLSTILEVSLPVAFELVKKPLRFCDIETKKEKRKSTITKNQQLRDMLTVYCKNKLE